MNSRASTFSLKQSVNESMVQMITSNWEQQALTAKYLHIFIPPDLLETARTTPGPYSAKKKRCKILQSLKHRNMHVSRSIGATKIDQGQYKMSIKASSWEKVEKISIAYGQQPLEECWWCLFEGLGYATLVSRFVSGKEEWMKQKNHNYSRRRMCYCETSQDLIE